MKLRRNLITVLAAAAIATAIPSASASAYSSVVDHNSRFDEGIPQPIKTERMKIAEWDGRTSLKANTCYFVEHSVSVKGSYSLPESSMLIVKNNACLKVSGKILVNGTVAVHSGAKLNIKNCGSVIFKSKSLNVINGTLAISKGGYAGIYGYVQCGGAINVKGSLKIINNGKLVCNKAIKRYPSAKIRGKEVISSEPPLYFVQELPVGENENIELVDNLKTGKTTVISGAKEKDVLIKSFESVLYKNSGEIDLSQNESEKEFVMLTYPGLYAQTESGNVWFGITDWNGIPLSEDMTSLPDKETLDGYFYFIVKGMPDEELFYKLIE